MRWTFRLLTFLAALMAADAFAGRTPQEFKERSKMSEEELAALKARSKSNLNTYGQQISEKPKEIPWMFVGMAAATLLVAAPFALRAYRNTAKEIAGANAFGSAGKRAREDEALD